LTTGRTTVNIFSKLQTIHNSESNLQGNKKKTRDILLLLLFMLTTTQGNRKRLYGNTLGLSTQISIAPAASAAILKQEGLYFSENIFF
ncbi:hypothetical protein ACJX0J_016917, partial [Zea mays]